MAAATREGLFRPSPLLTGGFALLVGAAALAAIGPGMAAGLGGLVDRGIAAMVHRPVPAEHVAQLFGDGAGILLLLLVVLCVAALAIAALPRILSRAGRGQTAVPLPRPPRLAPGATVLRLAGLGLFVLIALVIFRDALDASATLIAGETHRAATRLGPAAWKLIAAAGAVLVLVGGGEQAIERRRLWRDLHLTTLEARRENRALIGDPAIRSERRRRARAGDRR